MVHYGDENNYIFYYIILFVFILFSFILRYSDDVFFKYENLCCLLNSI